MWWFGFSTCTGSKGTQTTAINLRQYKLKEVVKMGRLAYLLTETISADFHYLLAENLQNYLIIKLLKIACSWWGVGSIMSAI